MPRRNLVVLWKLLLVEAAEVCAAEVRAAEVWAVEVRVAEVAAKASSI